MRAYRIEGSFGLENLKPAEVATPAAGPGQILVRLKAASLNYRDWLMVLGMYNPKQALPLIPLSDGAGVVEAVGPGVTRFKPGDRVLPIFAQGWLAGAPLIEKVKNGTLGGPVDGTLAEYICVSEHGAVPTPTHLTDEEAATLACAGCTAWSAVVEQGNVRPGDVVLTQGSGGVSVFALQFAKMLGATVIATSSSDAKLEKLKALGADHTINYRATPAWGKAARELTGGRGVDHVVEVGGAGTLEQSLRAVRFGGAISVIGVLAGTTTEMSLIPLLMQNVRLQGVLVGSRETFEAMNRAIAAHRLKPALDKVFGFDEAVEAFNYLGNGQHFGKVGVKIGL
jgi:NADPH:quinone reductase-like Zn-dependent oxidoreductase